MLQPRIYHGHRLRAGRRSQIGRVYIVTAVTRGRIPTFTQWNAARACARTLHFAPRQLPVSPLTWVVMPDHVHWMFALERGPLADVMRRFKAYSARAINEAIGGGGPVWQAGYHDRALRHDEDLRTCARYVIANPVRAGLCQRVGDYPFWDAAWLAERTPSDGSTVPMP